MRHEPGSWRDFAACRDTPIGWWFPTSGDSDGLPIPPEAAERCAVCPVRSECLDHAIRHERFGVWAGMSMRAIKRLRQAAGIRIDERDPFAEAHAAPTQETKSA